MLQVLAMQRAFDTLSEWIEWLFSTWWGVSLYGASCIATYVLGGWDAIDRWVYMSGAALVVLLIGSGRRDSKAMHTKLDDIDDRPELQRLEELTEREIDERRDAAC